MKDSFSLQYARVFKLDSNSISTPVEDVSIRLVSAHEKLKNATEFWNRSRHERELLERHTPSLKTSPFAVLA